MSSKGFVYKTQMFLCNLYICMVSCQYLMNDEHYLDELGLCQGSPGDQTRVSCVAGEVLPQGRFNCSEVQTRLSLFNSL